MNTGSLYSELTGKINRVRRREHGIALQAGIINALAAVVVVWALAISIEAVAEMDAEGRTALYWGAVGLSGVLAALLVAGRAGRYLGLFRGEDDDTIARRVGRRIPSVGDHLINTLQLYRTASSGALMAGYSPELVEASIAVEGEPLRHHDYAVIIEEDERKRALLVLLGATIIISGLFLLFPATYNGAFYRLSHYRQEFIKPAPFSLQIAPGDRKLMRGDSAAITVTAAGIPPRTVTLVLKSGDAVAEEIELRSDSSGNFHYLLPNLKGTTTYRAYSGPVKTPEHTFTVIERPEIRLFKAVVTAPAYTGRGVERLPDNVGDVSGIRGTSVAIRITTNIEPTKATIVQLFPRGVRLLASADAGASAPAPTSFDTLRIPMSVEGTSASGGFRLARDGEYYISILSADGIASTSPVHYSMSASADAPPAIALIEPTGAADINEKMLLPTEVQISDDYGFSRLRVMYRLAASKYAQPMKEFKAHDIPIPHGSPASLDVPYIWDMSGMNMVPEDEVEIYFEVYDNDAVSGPKMARTSTIKVRFPSLDDVLKQADQAQNQASADLDKMLKQAQETKKQMEEMNRELMKELAQNKQQASWQQQQKLQDIMKQHQEMEKKTEEIAENLRNMAEKLQEAKAISPETLQKYQDLQKLFQELKNPAMMEQMQKMQEEMQKMTPEQMAEAMKNFKFNEEQFRKSIERTMNILKRMQTEQKVDEMVRRAEELAKQQENLNKQAENTNPQDKATQQQLAEHQDQLAKQAEKMNKEAKDLEKQMGEQEEMPNKEMQEARESLEQENPQQQMEQASQEMQQGEMSKAQQKGENAQQSAQNFQKKMEGVKKKMQENSQRAVMNKMKKSMQDLLELSKREEDLKKQTDKTQQNSQQFRDQARQQQGMQEEMENIANQMMSLGQKSFAVTPEMGKEMGDAMRQMQNATGQLEQRDGQGASKQEGGAMGSMNKAAQMMGNAMAQMQNGQQQGGGMGMGMSMQQRLQQMSAQQQMINQAMGQGKGQGQGEGQGQGQGEGQGEGKDGKGKNGKQGKDGEGGEGEGEGQGDGKNGKNQRELQRLTQQQGQVKKSLDDLNKEIRESGGTRKNTVGDLERAAKELEEVLTDMRTQQVTPETMQRQERILSRLLDATKSNRERDFEKERESKSGVDVVRSSPPDMKTSPQEQARNQRDQLRSREQGYSKDYEYMIRRYFESIGSRPATTSQQ